MKNKIDKRWGIVLLCYLAFLVIISILAYNRMIPSVIAKIPYYDSIGHFLLFGIATFITHRALKRRIVHIFHLLIPLGPFIIVPLVIADEMIQKLSIYRTSSYSDFIADVCGIIFFYYLDELLFRRKKHIN